MELDRIGPARRDACPRFATGKQTWRELLFVHWEVPEAALRALVPRDLAIDTFDGRAYVGLVPFTMDHVRIGPVPIASFLETNLRTYVHAGGVPGVYFFSLDAESALAVWGARTFFRLPYFRARMASDTRGASTDYLVERLRPARDATLDVRWTITEADAHHAAVGTLEHFLTERYALYGPRRGGSSYRVRVHHSPWPLRRARIDRLVTTLPRAGGVDVMAPIDLVLASPEGVAVQTFSAEAIRT